jgi:predicted transglutaminase-like cysteine proteinase
MSDRATVHSSAVFFSINAVLLDTDRQRGRGPGAIRHAALKVSNSLTEAPFPAPAGEEVGKEPFGLFTFRVPDGMLWHKWKGVEADVAGDQVVLNRCRAGLESCPSHATRFLALIDAVAAKSGRARLDEANRAVNRAILYVHDSVQHGEADRWSAPLLTLAAGKGDCEDYAIAKYIALQEAGFSRDDMRVVLVRDHAVGQAHAALAARIDDRWLILDNRSSELIEDLDASSLTPLFAINYRGVQIFALPYASRMPSDTVTE